MEKGVQSSKSAWGPNRSPNAAWVGRAFSTGWKANTCERGRPGRWGVAEEPLSGRMALPWYPCSAWSSAEDSPV